MEAGAYVWTPDRSRAAWAQAHQTLQQVILSGGVQEVTLMVGLPGSGKSHFLSQKEPAPGQVFFDATFARPQHRATTLKVIQDTRKPVMVSLIWVDTPVSTCLERNALRPEGRRVPEEQILSMAESLRDSPPSYQEGFTSICIERSPSGSTGV